MEEIKEIESDDNDDEAQSLDDDSDLEYVDKLPAEF